MKPLVLYCRWHDAKLRLFGRDDTAVWGELSFNDRTEPFHFLLKEWLLTIGEGENAERIELDEMGVAVQQSSIEQ
ncbi:MAG: hypothetical protein WAM60_10665 [Candidatus Promineifilaceae bacterium]